MLDRINPGDMAGVDPGGSNARLQEAERSLARSKRDLAEAVGNARRLEQRVAEARRRLEQWRWINAGTGDPELAREAAIRVTMQTTAIETEEKFASDVAARITRLQSRVERQATRVFDLQTRRRDENVDAAHDPADENEARRDARSRAGRRTRVDACRTLGCDALATPLASMARNGKQERRRPGLNRRRGLF